MQTGKGKTLHGTCDENEIGFRLARCTLVSTPQSLPQNLNQGQDNHALWSRPRQALCQGAEPQARDWQWQDAA